MDLTTAKYIMDYLYFSRADEPTFQYYKNVSSFVSSNISFLSVYHLFTCGRVDPPSMNACSDRIYCIVGVD